MFGFTSFFNMPSAFAGGFTQRPFAQFNPFPSLSWGFPSLPGFPAPVISTPSPGQSNANLQLTGGAGNDILVGGRGDDTIDGGLGHDTIDGGQGNNRLSGGMGNDIISAGNGRNTVDGGMGNDRITLGHGDNTVDGGMGDDVIKVGNGANQLRGGMGRDTLIAGNGGNTLDGGMGDDRLSSGSGRDTLAGGAGNDTLDAGGGSDIYQFGKAFGSDRVVNTDAAADSIDRIVFEADSSIGAGQLWFRRDGSDLVVEAIGTGAAGDDSPTVMIGGPDTTATLRREGQIVLQDWYSQPASRVDTFQDAAGRTLDKGQVDNLVSAMAGFGAPPASLAALGDSQRQRLEMVIAGNWSA